MAQNTIDLRQDAEYDLLINKSMDLNAVLTATYYTGNTDSDIVNFDFTAYTGATLVVKQNNRSNQPVLTFSTVDGSIVLGTTDGKFSLIKSAALLSNVQTGTFEYSMYLKSATQSHRAFLSGNLIIETTII